MNMTYTFGTPEGSVGPDGYSLDYYYFVPCGHFALESHHTEIARLMHEFLGRVLK